MTQRHAPATSDSKRRIAVGLGWLAGALLAVSAFLPFWQARLFAPQYRNGLTATMYLTKVTGDIDEINELNHYVGVRRFETLAVWEKRLALPGLVFLIVLCLMGPSKLSAAAVASFPVVFLLDMKFWMHVASTKLDPTAPLKLKPFVIPILGTGKVGQFRSELSPMPGFILAVAAVLLLCEGLWLTRKRKAAGLAALAATLTAASVGATPLQGVIDRAPEGSVVELGSGLYEGPAVVSKRLTVRGEGAVVANAGAGTVITVRAPGVTIEGLTLRSSGDSMLSEDAGLRVDAASVTARRLVLEDVLFGVFASNAAGLVLEDSRLSGKPLEMGRRGDLVRIWNCDRARVSRNVLSGGRDMVLWFSTGAVIEGNDVSGGRYGLHFMHTDEALVAGNSFRNNSVGLYVMYSNGLRLLDNLFERHRGPSGSALGLKESDSLVIRGNVFRDNRQGIFVDGSPIVETNTNVFTGNRFSYNDVAISLMPGIKGNVFSANAFDDNLQQAALRGGGTLSGNQWTGNYWSDYAGYGRGERGVVPYRAERLLERLADQRPLARWFLYTPAAQAVELAARAFPLFKPKAILIDESPLLRAPRRDEPPRPAPRPVLAAVWAPAGLLSVSAAAVVLAGRRRTSAARRRARPAGAESALSASGLSKSFGARPLFSGLSFEAAPGECLVLWGSNGAGKSTLMRCLLGVERCEGELKVAGLDPARHGAEARERVGYLAQEFAGYDWTVRDAMDFVCEVRGADPAGSPALLALCGLAGQEDKPVPALSGGMKQKLGLAQALIGDPEILLLDEPCSSLDLKSRRELVEVFGKLKGTRTIVMTSHHLDEVEALADRVLWLDEASPARMLETGAFLAEASAGGRA